MVHKDKYLDFLSGSIMRPIRIYLRSKGKADENIDKIERVLKEQSPRTGVLNVLAFSFLFTYC